MAPAKVKLLDPRERALAQEAPIRDAANVPLSELPARMHELPPTDEVVLVAAHDDLAEATIRLLHSRGRSGRRAPFEYAELEARGRLWSPSPLVAEYADAHPPGRAIDLGCGTGRDAIYLAGAGWQVLAIDRLPEALARGAFSAEAILGTAAAAIEWRRADFGTAFDLGVEQGRFDLAVSCRVRGQGALDVAAQSLRSDGILLFEAFAPGYWAKRGRERSVETPGAAFQILKWDECHDIIRIIARRA